MQVVQRRVCYRSSRRSYKESPALNLGDFERVHILTLNLGSTNFSTVTDLLAGNVLRNIHELDLLINPWYDDAEMHSIAGSLPELRVLRLSNQYVMCSLCNSLTIPEWSDPPPPISYQDGYGLPVCIHVQLWSSMLIVLSQTSQTHYFMPLQKLHTVHFDIGWFRCGDLSVDPENKDKWSGECKYCIPGLSSNEELKASWMQKKEHSPRPPSLQRVEWRFSQLSESNDWPVNEDD